MCKTTTTGTQSGAKKGVGGVAPNTVPVAPDHALQDYLAKHYATALAAKDLGTQPADDSVTKLHVAISIYAHKSGGGDPFYAGIHHDEMHFSASLLKAAAMYAAFTLRAEARVLAAGGGFANDAAFFTALAGQFTSNDAVPAIRNAGASVGLQPQYKDILQVSGFGGPSLTVDFQPVFFAGIPADNPLYQHYKDVWDAEEAAGRVFEDHDPTENATTLAELNKVSHMYKMIVPSNNVSAAFCIRKLGYAYINVKLMQAGFYNAGSVPPKGVWLAADFGGGPRVEIDSLNDGKSAQATTSREMGRLFSLTQRLALIDPGHTGDTTQCKEMKALLREAHVMADSAWISRFGVRKYKYAGVKVGVANLKPNTPPKGEDVYSEGVMLKWKNDATKLAHLGLNGEISVCWQNVRKSAFDAAVPAIAAMIEKTFADFLAQGPV
jgi:hypothetical protein